MQSERRKRRLQTFCRRGELTPGAPPGGGPKPSFLCELRKINRDLFPYWHSGRARWQIYHVLTYGPTRSSDMLVHELEIDLPSGGYCELGSYAIAFIRACDLSQQGTLDRKQAFNEAWRQNEEAWAAQERDQDRKLTDMNLELAKDLRMHIVERESIVKPEGMPV